MDDKIRADIAARVKAIIVDELCVDEARVVPAATLVDDLGGDSLAILEMGLQIEEQLGLDDGAVSDVDQREMLTVADLLCVIEAQLAAPGVLAKAKA